MTLETISEFVDSTDSDLLMFHFWLITDKQSLFCAKDGFMNNWADELLPVLIIHVDRCS